jgi:murein DD-endopeptidase MepM/ murein hydrolase activator NlpD
MNFSHPVKNTTLSSSYGSRIDPFTGKIGYHKGLDYKVPSGTEVYSSEAGKVFSVGYNKDLGNFITIQHEQYYRTIYGHLTQSIVKTGQAINRNTLIGYSGNTGKVTGSHLHFAIKKDDSFIDPLSVLPTPKEEKKLSPYILILPILFFFLYKK